MAQKKQPFNLKPIGEHTSTAPAYPESKSQITPIAMARYIDLYAKSDMDEFNRICEENPSPTNTYGIDVATVRDWFINKYYPKVYDKKETNKDIFNRIRGHK